MPMDAAGLLPLLENGLLLLALVLVYEILIAPVQRQPNRLTELLLGVSVGVIGVIVVLTPWRYAPGVTFDMRSVLLSVSGLFFGAIPTLIAIAMTAAMRIVQGGAGALTGVIVIVATGGMGIAWRAWRKPAPAALSWGELYVFGVAVHVVMLLCMFTLPSPLALEVLQAIALPVLLLYPIVTMLLGRLLVNRQRRDLAVLAQQTSEARYQTLFREMLDGFALHEIICDVTGRPVDYRFLAVNPAFERLTGLRADAVVGRTVREVLPAIESYWIDTYGRVALTREPVFLENYAQGLGRHFEVTAYSPAVGQFATIFVDVTARNRAEMALVRRDNLLQALSYAAARFLEGDDWEQVMPSVLAHLGEAAKVSRTYLFQVVQLPTGAWEASQRFEWCAPGATPQIDNPVLQHALFQELGFARWEETLQRGDMIRGHVRDLPASERDLMAAQDVQSLVEVPIHIGKQWWGFVGFEQCDAEYEWSDAEIEALRAVGHALGAAIESRASRTQLQRQAEQLAQIMQSVPEGLVLLHSDGRVVATNPCAQVQLALLTGGVPAQLVRVGDLALSSLLAPIHMGQPQIAHSERHTFEVLANPVGDEETPSLWVLVIRDVTEELSRQQQLERQERMAAIGQLAAGIAHDFNNLMSIIILNAQLIEQAPAADGYVQERVRIIEQQGQRATQMIRQILDFSRRTAIERRPLNLAPLLKEQVKLLERTLPEHIKVVCTIAPVERYIQADPTRIEQMVMNLAVNARDAMPDGGCLEFTLDAVDDQAAGAATAPIPPGSWVRLTVRDSGSGIAAEHLAHIFEPFFTTKPVGIGTGLGLAQVHGIVGQHDGHIAVTSQPGQGTTFTIYLPALMMVTPELAPTAPIPQKIDGHGELILVAEDEAALRSTLTDLLERWHYRVHAVANGQEALAYIDANPHAIDLILSDVIMPEMSGLTLLRTLRQRQIVIPLILMTGHLQGEELDHLRQFGLSAWLAKPPGIDQLARTIAEVLAIHKVAV